MTCLRHETSLGSLILVEEDGCLRQLNFAEKLQPVESGCRAGQKADSELLEEAARQLDAYLAGQLKQFTIPLEPIGTVFQRLVWAALCDIPYGQTCSYGAIAAAIGKPRAARAVGLACNRNPLSIFIPCHRVIAADGQLTGYGGGLEIKRRLLDLEGALKPHF